MADVKLRFRIGVFVLIVLGALAVLLYLFGLFPNVFRKTQGVLYFVDFSDAPNVTVNTPVRRSGVKIGQVDKVELDEETGMVHVAMRVDPRYRMHRNEEPTLTTGLLSGDTAIDLVPKEKKEGQPEDRTIVEPGSKIDGRLAASVTRVLDRASAVMPPAQEALGRISQSLDKLEKMMPLIERTLEEYRLLARDSRRDLVPEVRKTNAEYQKLGRELNRSMPDLRATNTALQRLITDVNKLVPDVQKTIKSVNDTMPDVQRLAKSAADTMPDVQRLVNDLRGAVPDVRKLVRDVNGLVPDVQKMVQGINETIPQARAMLKEGTIAAKNWGVAGERVSVLIQTNEKAISDLLKDMDRAVNYVAETFSLENRNNLMTLLRNASEGSKRFPGMSDEAELMMRQGRSAFKKMDEAFDTLNKTIQPGSTPASGGVRKNLDEAVLKLNQTMTDVQDLVRLAARGDGTLRRFMADPALYNHADDAALMLSRVIPRMDRVLKDMEVFADKLARHPEAIGLNGVVHPSNGLKEPPRSVNYPHR